jgi:hypothetical protein
MVVDAVIPPCMRTDITTQTGARAPGSEGTLFRAFETKRSRSSRRRWKKFLSIPAPPPDAAGGPPGSDVRVELSNTMIAVLSITPVGSGSSAGRAAPPSSLLAFAIAPFSGVGPFTTDRADRHD